MKFCDLSAGDCGDEIARALEYEFREIEELVRKAIEQATSSKGKGWSFTEVRDAVNRELDRVKTSFALKVLEQEAETQARKFVQYHQLALTQLINHIAAPKQESGRGQHVEVGKFMVDALQDLFKDLLTQYRPHLNLDFPAPKTHVHRVLMEMKECSPSLEGIPQGVQDQELANIFRTLLTVEFPTTLRKIQFTEFLCTRLKALDSNSVEAKLHELLLSANFNEPTFFNHYTARLARKFSECQTQAERMEQVSFQFKTIAQLPIRPGLAFIPGEPSIKEQILDWLAQELHFQERKYGVAAVGPAKGSDLTDDFRIVFDLSVAQFAYLIKVFMETGIIQNKNVSELIRFFAKFTKTKRSENISYESFRIKYYNTEQSSKDMVKILLGNCLKHVNTN